MIKGRLILYTAYLGLLIYLVFWGGNYGRQIHDFALKDRINFIPFKDKMPYLQRDSNLQNNDWYYFWREVIGNLFLLFPVPLFLVLLEKMNNYKRMLLFIFLGSVLIEFVQLVLNIGQADIDDIVLNTFGATVGVALAGWVKRYQ